MSEPLKIRRFASLNVPYELTRERLDRLAGEAVGPCVHVHAICHREDSAGLPALTRVTLGCGHPAGGADPAFAMTAAEIYASAVSDAETRLEAEGHFVVRPDAALEPSVERAAAAAIEALLETLVTRLQRAGDPARREGQARPNPPDLSR
jgi:hypothetical protein